MEPLDTDSVPVAGDTPDRGVPVPPPAGYALLRAPAPGDVEPPATRNLTPGPVWGESDDLPGSPSGSIRPPDTTGTVDAPPAPGVTLPGSGSGTGRGMGLALAGGLVGAVIGTAATLAVVSATDAFDVPEVAAPAPSVTGAGTTTVLQVEGSDADIVPLVAEAVTPAVVRVDVVDGNGQSARDVALGSGVIYRSDGYVITNNHVVAEGSAFRVRLASGETLDAEVVGMDAQTDLAVLRVDRDGLPVVPVRETPLRVGELAIAIGSPFGLDTSVTAGVVSAQNRNIPAPDGSVIGDVVQTDAAINPGNSGGALVDGEGRLIGINTAILSETGGSQGVGFAIPSTIAVEIADELIVNGFVRHAFMGITGVDLPSSTARSLGLPSGGAVVDSVQPGSGADLGGLQPDDIIVAVDGEPLAGMTELVVVIRRLDPGDTILLTVLRERQEVDIEVVLGERPR